MQQGYMEEYQKKLVPGNIQKKRFERTYQNASRKFDLFSTEDSTLLKLLQSEKDEQMEMDSIFPSTSFLNSTFQYSYNGSQMQRNSKRNTNLDSVGSRTPNKAQKGNSLSSFYLFLDDYTSSFMDTKISTILTREFSSSEYLTPKRK